jgi:triacylglycerol esterase/lipase EstA (alpha/beta hydrolase family)
MTSLIVSVALAGGSVAYAIWSAHRVALGEPVWWFVAAVPVVYLAPAIVFASACCVMAWLWRTPRPPEARIGIAASLKLLAVESWTIAAGWPIMALHRWLLRDPAPAPAARPIVLIHGVLCNDGVWFALRRHLARAGIGPVYTLNYGPIVASAEHFASQLAARIAAVRAATGAEHVVLVGHSLGGLVARAYLRRFGGAYVSRLITVGTPHHGSMFAWLFPGWCLAQMRPGNAWLVTLNRDEGTLPPVPTTALWSRHDTMIAPQASAKLGGAENVALVGIGHNALLRDPQVHARVAAETGRPLSAAGSGGLLQ